MYPAELEIKDTTESTTSVSYLYLLLSIGRDGQLHNSIYDKRDDFNLHITNFPFLSRAKREVPRDVRNTKVQKQDKFRRYWSQH